MTQNYPKSPSFTTLIWIPSSLNQIIAAAQLLVLPWSCHCFLLPILTKEARTAMSNQIRPHLCPEPNCGSHLPLEARPTPKCDLASPIELALYSLPRLASFPVPPVSLFSVHTSFLMCRAFALPVFSVLAVFHPCTINFVTSLVGFLTLGPPHTAQFTHSLPHLFFLFIFFSSKVVFLNKYDLSLAFLRSRDLSVLFIIYPHCLQRR